MTPIDEIDLDLNNNKFYIKRDDLLPFAFGGNKVRIAKEFIDDMHEKKRDCLIGYGNARSNLSRAIANYCSKENIKCHIISPADEDGNRIETFNSLLSKRCSVVFHECLKTNVANTVEEVIAQCREEGYNPYYIYGSKYGTGNEITPVRAYFKAYKEIKTQLSAMSIDADYIFLTTGTGMTQSGLIAGNKVHHGKERIIGISVARNKEKEKSVIKSYLNSYKLEVTFEYDDRDIIIDDSYICGGYGKYDSSISNTIFDMYLNHGIPLDPTYTGKAFKGMIDYIKKNEIANKNILFLHTGGTPLFFDFILKQEY